jgi:hypothetical protein
LSRRGVVWLLTLPLAVVGSQLGHALAYRLITSNEAERDHELTATGHAYLHMRRRLDAFVPSCSHPYCRIPSSVEANSGLPSMDAPTSPSCPT